MVLGLGASVLAAWLVGCDTAEVVALNHLTITDYKVVGRDLQVSGVISVSSLGLFAEVMEKNPQVERLVLLEMPGSVNDEIMIRLAYRVRELGLDTHLTAESRINSGSVDLFLSGVERTMEKGAQLGVHSWADGKRDARDYPRDSPEHEMNRAYIEAMLGSDDFFWFTIYAAPADEIHVMTAEEIARYGLLTRPPIQPGTKQ